MFNTNKVITTIFRTFLSKSFITHLFDYALGRNQNDILSVDFLKKIGALSPHTITEDCVAILEDNQIKNLIEGYNNREDKTHFFSREIKKTLADRKFNVL